MRTGCDSSRTGRAYSNIGYLKLARLIEQVTGSTLRVALGTLVSAPCQLATARPATSPADLEGVRMGAVSSCHPGWAYHGLVVGTVADAARLLGALVAGRLLEPGTRGDMMQGRRLPQHRGAAHLDPAHGLGLVLSALDPGDHPVGHAAAGPGGRIAVCARRRSVAASGTAWPSATDPDLAVRRLSC